jgi:transcriptional regulator with XRE-family HTH domain
MNIGSNIRRFRLQQGMTQQDVANICNLTKGMISKIESGKVTPALATLTKIANAVGVDIVALMSEKHQRAAAFTPAVTDADMYVATDLGYKMCGLARKYFQKQMQPILIMAKKGEVVRHLVSHDDEEFIYVLTGTLIFQVDERLYTLKAGDNLYFDGTRQHGIYEVVEDTLYLDIFMGAQRDARATGGLNRSPSLVKLEQQERKRRARHKEKE